MQQFGLIGKSLGHSFSKDYFTEKFQKEQILARYANYELPQIEPYFKDLVQQTPNLCGLNVTIPYKTEIIPLLDELVGDAQKIGAVNTIQFSDGKLIGHNTDTYGFRQSIKPFLRNVHERALILGTGGAAKAVAYVLESLGIDVCFLSREASAPHIFNYNAANENMVSAFKLIVNTTPLGTFPNISEQPPFPIHLVNDQHLIIDLIYNPSETKFLKTAKEQGADILNGLSMLKHQADKAWEIWNGPVL